MQKETIKNMLKNSIYAQMWRENPQFRKDIKTALAVFGFGILMFVYGSIKGCTMDKKSVKQESVIKKNTDNKLSLNALQLFGKANSELQR